MGHSVVVFEKRSIPGGLSSLGIIGLREPLKVALAEVEMIRRMGVEIRTDIEFGKDITLEQIKSGFQAVFIGVGLGSVPELGIEGEASIVDGLKFIEESKITPEKVKVGKNVTVIGAGNTAIDCATVAKRLGAEKVTIVYRRSENEMTAYRHEYEFAKSEGIEFRFLSQPVKVEVQGELVSGLACIRMGLGEVDSSGRPSANAIDGSEFVISTDQIIKAIGQEKPNLVSGLALEEDKGYIKVSGAYMTSLEGVFAGGDCIRAKGSASTVMAAQDGKLAAKSIHTFVSTQ